MYSASTKKKKQIFSRYIFFIHRICWKIFFENDARVILTVKLVNIYIYIHVNLGINDVQLVTVLELTFRRSNPTAKHFECLLYTTASVCVCVCTRKVRFVAVTMIDSAFIVKRCAGKKKMGIFNFSLSPAKAAYRNL